MTLKIIKFILYIVVVTLFFSDFVQAFFNDILNVIIQKFKNNDHMFALTLNLPDPSENI